MDNCIQGAMIHIEIIDEKVEKSELHIIAIRPRIESMIKYTTITMNKRNEKNRTGPLFLITSSLLRVIESIIPLSSITIYGSEKTINIMHASHKMKNIGNKRTSKKALINIFKKEAILKIKNGIAMAEIVAKQTRIHNPRILKKHLLA